MERNNDELKFNQIDEYMYEENHEMFYANSLDVQTSITDFMINFKQSTPNGFLNNQKIIMNPSLAKQLKNVLEQAFYQHEQMHGEVKDIDTLQNEMSNFYDED
ncbi:MULTISPECIES: DUF3467 domain-containing protein [Mammaliicoccus]|uniref:DUF3467 domain-containing protein n=2 Tax=Mammaliicoccus vitulinus TaxID=71237 RepID=A0A2T4PS01_9STAP|nr:MULTISPECIES: DUF3467 domain-containing protein [Mammaliicoccus]HAL08776.1 DUF3467 domain-containing protein [Staphylococcus sp.]MBO3076935.1 DUF3467 domain-containing protein [Mammaliicoccus vitulinus]PTI29019.1 DUF3467 domain-containing protein [Mammaliicoccus vitulinus]PTI34880.1 DUF3467 domain-containing protein [Mammaliicoccus vitulinus]PTI69163.1 DUF3467 domain-containing protein [Mammaliicoccus vitulinus]